MLEGRKVTPGSDEEHEIKWAASSLYTGGADTVSENTPTLPTC